MKAQQIRDTYLGFFAERGHKVVPSASLVPSVHDPTVLLTTAGLVTAVPLLCFGGAATRVPLTTLGLLQYVAPTLQFLLGITVGGEPMSVSRWVGFAVIWAALALFSFDTVRSRRQPREVVEASAV